MNFKKTSTTLIACIFILYIPSAISYDNCNGSQSIYCLEKVGKLNLKYFKDYKKYSLNIKAGYLKLVAEEAKCQKVNLLSGNTNLNHIRKMCGAAHDSRVKRYKDLSVSYALLKKHFKELKDLHLGLETKVMILDSQVNEAKSRFKGS